MPVSPTEKTWTRLAIVTAILAPAAYWFGPVFWKGEVLAFRDSANFYLPLFEWECREWGAGRIPLWNSHDNLGTPALAEATSCVLYPGKLLFALPLAFTTRFNLYLVGHVLLAAAGAYSVAKHWTGSTRGAALCAMSYAYGGNVLFQYSNVVFLVSAAWLPWALWTADRMITRQRIAAAILLGFILALMTLGGDPQMAYNAWLLAALYAWMSWRMRRVSDPESGRHAAAADDADAPPLLLAPGRLSQCNRPALLFIAALVWFVFAAVQILPSMEWTRRSDRAVFEQPRSVYEAATYALHVYRHQRTVPAGSSLLGEIGAGLFTGPRATDHSRTIYHFSVGPWHWLEWLWPNFSGRMFPRNERWISRVPAEGGVWTPSMYAGLLPLLAASCALRWTSSTVRTRWLIASCGLSILAACGWYGAGWFARECYSAIAKQQPHEGWLGSPVGGLYWGMTLLLPGYAYFRYPAKLLVIASLAVSLLAAQGWSILERNNWGALRRRCVWIAGVSFCGLLVLIAFCIPVQNWFSDAPPSYLYGPLDGAAALRALFWSFVHTTVVADLLRLLAASTSRGYSAAAGVGMLLLTGMELSLANGSLIATVPSSTFGPPSPALDLARLTGSTQETNRALKPRPRLLRSQRVDWRYPSWRRTASNQRLHEIVQWEQSALLQKYHLRYAVGMIEAPTTFRPYALRALLEIAQSGEWGEAADRNLAGYLAADYVMSVAWDKPDAAHAGSPLSLRDLADGMSAGSSRVWLTREVRVLPGNESRDPIQLRARMTSFWEAWTEAARDRVRLPHPSLPLSARAPLNEGVPLGDLLAWPESSSAGSQLSSETCRIVRDEPQCVEVSVNLTSPGWLVLNDLYDPGWYAEFQTAGSNKPQPVRMEQVNFLLRGVSLPAGTHRVRFVYSPASFAWGAAISVAGVVCLLIISVYWRMQGNTASPSFELKSIPG